MRVRVVTDFFKYFKIEFFKTTLMKKLDFVFFTNNIGIYVKSIQFANFVILSENRFFGYDSESKEYKAEAHRERIFGKHVADYMKALQEEDEDAYKRQFSKFVNAGIGADGLEGVRRL